MKVNIGKYPEGDETRKINIHIDKYDAWNVDHTLALIIHPLLIKLKEVQHGAPYVADEDVPKELVGEDDDLIFKRWDWVLVEMIWAFGAIVEDKFPISDKETERITNGTRLFGKYYQGLWD